MAGKAKWLRQRGTTWFVRVGVPKDLREIVGKSELHEALGGNQREAERRSHAVLTRFHAILDEAKLKLAQGSGTPPRLARTLDAAKLAHHHYQSQLDEDAALRDSGALAKIGHDRATYRRLFEGGYTSALREVVSGIAPDDKIGATIGWAIDAYAADKLTKAEPGTPEWRALARTLAGIQLEVLQRQKERDEGQPEAEPAHPALKPSAAPVQAKRDRVSILDLLDGYLAELRASGRGAEAEKRWTPGFKQFVRHLGHDDASRLTKADVVAWKDALLTTMSPKTVRDTNVAALRAVFQWAVDNDRLKANPAKEVKVRVLKKVRNREKGFTLDEAKAVLKAARDHSPAHSDNPRTRESAPMTAAKRWVPWLCAHTGARVAEMTQLRKQDVREENGIAFVRIAPEAGSVKSGQYRDAPLHPQIVEMGFLDFVKAAPDGPLFYVDNPNRAGKSHPSKQIAGRLAMWVRALNVIAAEVDPNHGWRHRFKTVARELGLDPRVIDKIQGHAARTAGEDYGDVTLKAAYAAIKQMPHYTIAKKADQSAA
ncbi:UNVERIFIED_ORG: integrase [Xanthobacter viscosus]|uniref:Integrase family protein n=1 Tax=Xanthobacter autotrophicus TaxID=280 RepID=A0A6C1KLT4_XANAU|nr:DUF6538 domain-containing protein [Xanthobacter autotrophicus]TLX44811.1 hypothetical protein FBQ73_01815 [Xanthobacter autotrophicus]